MQNECKNIAMYLLCFLLLVYFVRFCLTFGGESPGYSQLAKSVCVNWFSIVLPSSLMTDELSLSSNLELFCCAIDFPGVFFPGSIASRSLNFSFRRAR